MVHHSIRAKFRCSSVEQSTNTPTTVQRYVDGELVDVETWPRVFRFNVTYDQGTPEDQRFAQATPSGDLRIVVDNPRVAFEPGHDYYLDFTPVEKPETSR